jgi:type I restriction enzyme S subunit
MAGRYHFYSEYKESGIVWVGKVPDHWQPVRFKHVLLEKKKTSNPSLEAGSISFGNVVFKNSDNLSAETKDSYQEVLAGEFLINPLNLNYDLRSLRTALSEINVVVSTGYIVLLSNDRLIKKYTRWLLQQFDVAHMKTLGSGVRQTINYSDIRNSFFFEPSQDEQTKIANFLDHETAKIDTLIDKQQQLIKLLKEKRQAVISHAVTKGLNPATPMTDSGIEWLGEVPDHWVTPALKYVCSLLKDGTHLPPPRVDDGIPLLSVRNIIDGQFVLRDDDSKISYSDFLKLKQSFEVLEGDVLLAVVGGTLGKTAIVKKMDSFHIQRSVAIFRCKANLLSNIFLNLIFQSKQFEELLWSNVGFSAQPGIYLGALSDFRMPIPPIEEQMKIVEKVSNDAIVFDNLLSVAQKKIALLQERRTALISAAVTGKIDVRNWQPALSELGKEG